MQVNETLAEIKGANLTMIRAFGMLATAAFAAYVVGNNGQIGAFNFGDLPLAFVAFVVLCGGLLYSLRSI